MANKRTQKSGTCIFCREGGLSKEDFYPRWLRRHFPPPARMNTRHRMQTMTISSSGRTTMTPITQGTQSRPGHTISRKLHLVCKKCNNGWMSQLQEAAKPLLLELFNQRWSINSDDDRLIVCRWITMFNIVSEFMNEDTIGISESDRQTFYRTCNPLPNWKIWLAWHNGSDAGAAKQEHGNMHHRWLGRRYAPDPDLYLPAVPDSQVTTVVCVNLLFQMFSTSASNLHVDENYWSAKNGLAVIHPNSGSLNKNPTIFHDDAWQALDRELALYATSCRAK
jgi:hypothetical protein